MQSNDRSLTTSFFGTSDVSLNAFKTSCEQTTQADRYPLAAGIQSNVVIYNGDDIRRDHADVRAFQSEMADVLLNGPGVFAVKKFFADNTIIDEMSRVFESILAAEHGFGAGDHFGKTGPQANGRIWNVFQKSAEAAPPTFVHYYKNPLLSIVSEAWLGPHYQVTAQVNIVRPGGDAQVSHRDYHLGFQQPKETARYPLHIQKMSAMLTLQGAVAHTDMPLESGPTKLLPFSQHYPLGYIAYHDKTFQEYFEAHYVQVALEKGDAVFFNPALFHAAGANRTQDFHRSANLLQVSSTFAKPMETVHLAHISQIIYPSLSEGWKQNAFSHDEKNAIITAATDGYSFPTNLDTDPPIGGLAPESMASLLTRALDNEWTLDQYQEALTQLQSKQQA
ncbi:phytanoyl-CoA dioxygenase family protein [Enterovibrio sp. ZSDZ42]|uniref:Phytanoyl-CoA dioxygenase family protein n=1 Tax=Enterovibrio gelatinilyticus TaxID=2899819 RepID=A0ABT5R733_9GAMM|nr:phytanoyl-CoA dioxygenase family protein [Enterovibrio sp. ZSDZ42]MDD1796066.1 phytanoyl-CoA dioxygenase family protein [Enterovibrio sp. ZSDZ42]